MFPPESFFEARKNREVTFAYRRRTYRFSLSLELFSSANIDTGSRFLLKVFSEFLDREARGFLRGGFFRARSPCSVLDAGSGTGVLGICAAGALADISAPPADFHIRAQDRDCLARLFTEYNARENGISSGRLSAHTEPLLAGPPGRKWDIILTNIPAKAGLPVLEDFVNRSAGLLSDGGRVFLVAVNPLADFFRSQIAAAGAPLFSSETGKEHTVFVYGKSGRESEAVSFDERFPSSYPFYIRNRNDYSIENISYHLDTVYGAPDFDEPGRAVLAAAELAVKIDLASKLAERMNTTETETALLINDSGQGHFALWLARYLKTGAARCRWVLSGRNVLALAAAGAALGASMKERPFPSIVPAADVFPDWELPGSFAFTAFFPETISGADVVWENLTRITAPEGIVILGMASADTERFDRKKPAAFTRAGDLKRKGFRAAAYRRS